MKHLLVIILASIFITACNKPYQAPPDPGYSKVAIHSVNITALPLNYDWDPGTGPDVAFRVFNPLQNMIANSSTVYDVWSGMLPLKWDFGGAIIVPRTDFSKNYTFMIYDEDGSMTQQMANILIRFDNVGWQNVITIDKDGVRMELHLEWIK